MDSIYTSLTNGSEPHNVLSYDERVSWAVDK